jgi:hypothetical protein
VTHHESVPKDLPIDDIQIDIALDWSAAQALAAYQWLEVVRERIWLLYGQDIVHFLRDDTSPMTPPSAGADDPPL